ncbi:MAG: hypothetical protein ACYSSL_06820 [Planctomycetota bacterium]
MAGRKSKFIFLLIVYFAGFATAIYCLAPSAGQNEIGQASEKMFVESACKSEQFAQSFNSKMHIALDYAKGASRRVGRFIKQQINKSAESEGIKK